MSLSSQSAIDLKLSGAWQTKWIKRAIIASVFVIAGFVIPDAIRGDRLDLGLIAILPALLGVLFLLRYPQIGFPILVIANLVVPSVIGTGTETSVSLSLLLTVAILGLWLLDRLSAKLPLLASRSPVIPPLIILMLVSVVSFGFGQIRWLPSQPVSVPAQLGGLALFLLLPALFLVTMERLRDIKYLKWSTWLFVFLGWGFVITLLVPGLRSWGLQIYQRAVFDSMFWTWMAVIGFSQAVFNSELKLPVRVLLGGIVLSVFYFTIVVRQSWTSGWLPAVIGILFIIIMKKPKLLLVGLAIGVVLLAFNPEMLNSVFLGGDNEYSLATRLEAWRIVGRLISLNPLFGLGPATYYNYTPLFSILGFSVRFNSHNNYVDIVAQIGLLGLLAFLWFAWKLFWLLWNNRETPTEGFPRAFMYGALGGLIATLAAGMLGDWFLPFVYNIGLEGFRSSSFAWLYLGAAAGFVYLFNSGSPHRHDERAPS